MYLADQRLRAEEQSRQAQRVRSKHRQHAEPSPHKISDWWTE